MITWTLAKDDNAPTPLDGTGLGLDCPTSFMKSAHKSSAFFFSFGSSFTSSFSSNAGMLSTLSLSSSAFSHTFRFLNSKNQEYYFFCVFTIY